MMTYRTSSPSRMLVSLVVSLFLLVSDGHGQTQDEHALPGFAGRGPSNPTLRANLPLDSGISFAAIDTLSLRGWETQVDRWLRSGELELTSVRTDTLVPSRTHERLSQYYRGAPVFGGEITRQLDRGQSLSMFGGVYPGIDVDTVPTISPAAVRDLLGRISGGDVRNALELVVLPREDRTYALTYTAEVWSEFDLVKYFVDAHTGTILDSFSVLQRQTARATIGTGLAGDLKKLSVTQRSDLGGFVARDRRRPASIETYDFRFDWWRGKQYLEGEWLLSDANLASNPDGMWADQVTVDVHSYVGWTYDYLYERFGRQGLDGFNRPIKAFVHWLRPSDYWSLPEELRKYSCNAFYYSDRIVIGDGTPQSAGGCKPLASLGIVAHELAHGVIDHSSALIYRDESGALNEAFADILGFGAEAYHASQGQGLPYPSNSVIGDQVRESGFRDIADPERLGYKPKEYRDRRRGDPDHGYVHTNSLIASHAFYLAVNGGQNYQTGLYFSGTGAGQQANVVDAFFRAFVYLLPTNATMAMARLATVSAHLSPAAIEGAIRLLDQPSPDLSRGDIVETVGR